MDLISVTIQGWRKFKKKTTLQTNGKLVSILGPNEAGKSSVLDALVFLDSHDEVQPKDIARGSEAKDVLIAAYFHLTTEEREQAGLTVPTRLIFTKKATGHATFQLEPKALKRDIRERVSLSERITKIIGNVKFSRQAAEEQVNALSELQRNLNAAQEDLSSDVITEVRAVADMLESINLDGTPAYIQKFGEQLRALADSEAAPNPHDRASEYIKMRIPDFLLFGVSDRNLQQEYSFESLKSEIPVALSNLTDIAGLSVKDLISSVSVGDRAGVETLRVRANQKLRQNFEETWSQSGVRVSLVIMDQALQVLIENDDSEFTALAERSDGFRQFVALQAFIMKRRKRDPILLIDEAETHLHYDAQADLVQMLGRQKVAQKVIYTTHSAGCLPEDLGNGVRLVACDSDGSTSHIVNRFWGTKEPGFSPLLIGMGASTLAFFPTRRALMAEGETEMLLLPTLLREALAKAVVGFQVVPGTAKANKSLLPKATAKQSYIAYLVDADEAGGEIRRQLKKNGVEDGAIFSLPASEGEEREIEDFIEDSILIRSMNAIIEKFSPGASHSKMAKLPVFSKVDILSNEYKKITSKEMSKVDLSYEVLNIVSNSPGTKILCADKKEHFEKFSRDIEAFFSPRD